MKEKREAAIELKPCPFCGSDGVGLAYKPHPIQPNEFHGVSCLPCGAHGGFQTSEKAAIEKWNARAGLAAASQWKVIETDGLPDVGMRRWITFEDAWDFGRVKVSSAGYDAKTGWYFWHSGKLVEGNVLAWQDYEIPAPFTKGETEE